jgi:hypothetical protein
MLTSKTCREGLTHVGVENTQGGSSPSVLASKGVAVASGIGVENRRGAEPPGFASKRRGNPPWPRWEGICPLF